MEKLGRTILAKPIKLCQGDREYRDQTSFLVDLGSDASRLFVSM